MLGLPLIYEMTLLTALVYLIGWLMGRTLCKSKEHEERAAKKSLQAANERLDALLIQKDSEIHQLSQRLQTAQQVAAELQHQHKTTEHLLTRLQQEHEENLAAMQKLTAYPPQLEELGKVHDEQSRQVITLQTTIKQMQDEKAQAATTLAHMQDDKRNAETLIAEQQATLARYQQKQQAFENESGNQDALIAQLRKQIASLQTENGEQRETIAALNTKVNSYLQSVDSTNRRISSMLDTLPSGG